MGTNKTRVEAQGCQVGGNGVKRGDEFGNFDAGFVVSGDQFVVFVLHESVFAFVCIDSEFTQGLAREEGWAVVSAD
jgi:hypothetical protein